MHKFRFKKLAVVVLSFLFTFPVSAQLDTTFGTNGRVSVDIAQEDIPTKILQKSDGKILVISNGRNNDLPTLPYVTQYNANGEKDTSFGVGGVLQLTDPADTSRSFLVYDTAVQADGKLIVAGSFIGSMGGGVHSFITRINSNGSIDTGFGNNGFQYPLMGPGSSDYIRYVKVLADGKISLAGKTGSLGFGIFFIRYDANGVLDSTFNGQGYVFSSTYPSDVDRFEQQSNGKFLLFRQPACCSANYTALRRMNSDGTFDNTFSVINLPNSNFSRFYLSSDDKIYVVSFEINDYQNGTFIQTNRRQDISVYRYLPDGALDTTFGINGKTKFGMAGYFDNKPFGLVVRPNGQIFVGTETNVDIANRKKISGRKFGIAKLESNGTVSGRYIMTDLNIVDSISYEAAGTMALLDNGKIISAFSNQISQGVSNLVITQLNDAPPIKYNVRFSPFSTYSGYSAYPSVFRPSSRTFYYFNGGAATFGLSTDIPVVGQYFDSLSEFAVFRPSNGTWYLCNSCGEFQWGASGDIPVYSGDFDGDSRNDFTTFRPSSGVWSIRNSESGTNTILQWGINGDIPVPGDYDGDGKDDIAVFRPSDGGWYILNSSNSQLTAIAFGTNGDIPVAEDYDGDGKFDIAVYRPSNGTWYRLNSSTNYSFSALQWGISTDIPVPADYNGDGKTDAAVFRNGDWYIMTTDNYSFMSYRWGLTNDIPLARRQ